MQTYQTVLEISLLLRGGLLLYPHTLQSARRKQVDQVSTLKICDQGDIRWKRNRVLLFVGRR